jgi:glycosyltransferase involved in cell wall biosynthesis
MSQRVLFVSPMCLLDRTSGAAISMKALLEQLAAAGMRVSSLTASLFDTRDPYPLETVLGPQAKDPASIGKLLILDSMGVRHGVLRTERTEAPQRITQAEATRLRSILEQELASNPPDVVLSYGSSPFSRRLQAIARAGAKRFCHYLANPDYRDRTHFLAGDYIVCPSEAMAGVYRERLGVSPAVMRSLIPPNFHLPTTEADIPERTARRRAGVIAFLNPTPSKGVQLFARIADMARKQRPDLTFVVTEGRSVPDELAAAGYDLRRFDNVWWLPNQKNMRRLYERASLLLLPSLWFEPSARSAAEAQLSGIPVLATRQGGLPEQLNGGGWLFDPPTSCSPKSYKPASEAEAAPWLETIGRLMDDAALYDSACRTALAAAAPLHIDRTGPAAVRLVQTIAEGRLPPSVG